MSFIKPYVGQNQGFTVLVNQYLHFSNSYKSGKITQSRLKKLTLLHISAQLCSMLAKPDKPVLWEEQNLNGIMQDIRFILRERQELGINHDVHSQDLQRLLESYQELQKNNEEEVKIEDEEKKIPNEPPVPGEPPKKKGCGC